MRNKTLVDRTGSAAARATATLCLRLVLCALALAPLSSHAGTRYWIGTAGGSFSQGSNWTTLADQACGVIGEGGSSGAPGPVDVAIFKSCDNDAVIDATSEFAGITIDAAYDGTITQNPGVVLTIGVSNWLQAGGSFVGGNSALIVNGTFTLSGGAFTSTSARLTVHSDWTVSGGTFNHNGGTLAFPFTAIDQSLSIGGSITLHHLSLGGAYYRDVITLAGGTTLTVEGTLTLAGTYSAYPVTVNGGSIVAKGNIVQAIVGGKGSAVITVAGTGAQTITGGGAVAHLLPLIIDKPSGTLTLSGVIGTASNWTHSAGTVDPGTSTLQIFNDNIQSLTISGSHALNNVTIGGASISNHTLTIAAGTTLTVNGTLRLAAGVAYAPDTINGGTIAALGNITQGPEATLGTTVLSILGTGAQTLTGGGRLSNLLPLLINKPSGTLTLSGNIGTTSNWTYSAGTVDPGSSTIQFFNKSQRSLTLSGSHALNNVIIGGNFHEDTMTIAAGTTLTVNGYLNFATSYAAYPATVNGGAISVKGALLHGTVGANGSTLVTLSGSGAQSWTSAGGTLPGASVTVNKASGTVTLASNVLLGTTQALNITAGTLDQGASYNLRAGAVTVGASGVWNNAGSGDVTLGGTVSNSGAIAFSGGLDCAADTILIRSTAAGTQRAWNGTGTFAIEDVNVQDQGGTAAITAYSSTKGSNVGANWTFSSGCLTTPVLLGGFNAFEGTTAAGALTGVIKTKVAGSAFSLDVVAINATGDDVLATFTGDVKVEVLEASDNTGDYAGSCRSTWTPIADTATTLSFAGSDAGRKGVSLSVAGAAADVRVRMTYPASGPATATSCSTDNFAVRPAAFASFSATDTDWEHAGTTRNLINVNAAGGNVHKAGQPFTLRATAVNSLGATTTGYTGTPTYTHSACAGSGCPASPGTLVLDSPAANAGLINSGASYSEAGSFGLQLSDASFASVDAGDGSSEAEMTIASPVLAIGRFVPDHFDLVSLAAPVLQTFGSACASRSFTYFGQPFGYATLPQATLTARNAGGGTTAHYSGALWPLSAANVSQAHAPTPVSPTLDVGNVLAPTLTSNDNGTGTIAGSASTRLRFERTTPLAAFAANIALGWSVADASEAGVAGNGTITTPTPLSFANIDFDAGNEFRFGLLHLTPAHGSDLLDLPVSIEARSWDGVRLATNTADQCTSFATSAIAMGNYQKNLAACATAIAATTLTLVNGRAIARLQKPGNGNDGSVDLTLQLGASAAGETCASVGGAAIPATAAGLPWLLGKWRGGADFDANPMARASFGRHRSPLIYRRENY